MIDRRQQLRELYGFDFPESLFRFWDFARRLRPLDPLQALVGVGLQLVGPFEVLAGRFDRHSPRLSHLLHWRYYFDPPEFFTVLVGEDDGLHWGCYLDDPTTRAGCVASYYAAGAFEMTLEGDDLFAAVRLLLEEHISLDEEERSHSRFVADEVDDELTAELVAFRETLIAFSTGERSEVGAAYVDRYAEHSHRRTTARTQEGMGIVVSSEQYRPLSFKNMKLWYYLSETDDPLDVVAEARQALREGFPGTALKLGKDLWAIGGERHTEYAYELLDAAYAALGREVLREVLQVHRANRDLPSVDILENEG